MKPNIVFYMRKINEIVTRTEELGEELNPYYEKIRTAIDESQIETLTQETLVETYDHFKAGTDEYEKMLSDLKELKPTVKIIGIHKKLEKAFSEYVEGCQEMCESIDTKTGTVNETSFNQSEEKQDAATKSISFCIQKIAQLVR